MNYVTTTSSTYENNMEKVEILKKQNEKINELLLIIQEKEHEINCLKKKFLFIKKDKMIYKFHNVIILK
jgi:hypothetical protein